MSDTIEDPGTAYRDEDWPFGLVCTECGHVLREGERFSERLDAFSEDIPMTRAVCLGCALAPT
jgi:hypothetical protein